MWTKYDYLCTNCDALIEVTALEIPRVDPDCICGNGMVINIGTSPAFEPIITDVSKVTPTRLVKINTNPYN
jgi:hypothetical protein